MHEFVDNEEIVKAYKAANLKFLNAMTIDKSFLLLGLLIDGHIGKIE